MEKETKVCVTGAASFLGSWLVKKLLEKGYTVHATLRNLGDPYKVGLLSSLPNAGTKLRLYEADVYNPGLFKQAIEGCEYVVHMATPLLHQPLSSQFKNTSEAAVAGVKSIMELCIRSGTVKRLIYTASVTAASPIKENGKGFKDRMDESCWTLQEIALPYSNELLVGYTCSKTLSEKELLRYNGELEVVSLVCGLVGGKTLLSSMPESMGVLISQAAKNKRRYRTLRFLEELLGRVPILHIEDVCNAHIFCLEKPSIKGRFLCASAYLSSADIASHSRKLYPHIEIPEEFVENLGREISWGSAKLEEVGFGYKCDVKMILEDSINCGLRLGECGAILSDFRF
ncbi:NAD(P)-binding Rossmann-fold superfamily protein, putative [Theobroma cacao]|uniref:NAD(P)-binding Rossmann-fold superfamily protein, putative n=1 Tax=Theobroma cacao TaxID=3641 RepID=A0A061DSJ8_THECC|nr:NAD(P)-binding Rossmann-fold superfamily protein, putative [Theobroma cacao]